MFILFFLLVMIMYVPMSYYVGYRLWQVLKHFFPNFSTLVYIMVFTICCCLIILNFTVGRWLPHTVSEVVITAGLYWLVSIIYLFAVILIFDFIRFLSRFLHLTLPYCTSIPYAGLIAVAFVTCLLIYGTWNARQVQITPYEVIINKDAGSFEELNVVMVSDLHLSTIVHNGRLKEMVEKINALNPDLVLIPGDIIEDTQVFIEQNMLDTFKELKARYGVFLSPGNHEYYGGSIEVIVESLEQIGFQVLRDSYVQVADSFYVVGREDSAASYSGFVRNNLPQVLDGVDKNLPIILLDHQPVALKEAQNEGVDLQVSGHTHKGQAFPANLITSRLFEKDYGYLKKGSYQLIVTCGYGTWGPPLRIGSNPEIVHISISFHNT